ncbi:MAG: DNA mismatch repair endonuclease MutL [Gemmatimonadales bacterium]|nr:DNA mismatch repair endonuclease MutL [Gemmatimonadales bacterium]
MPRRIQILPDHVADQIAAGEVVERPASVVKELVENAIDAGATSVLVELEGGGKTLVRVADDGVGMGRDDAVLALDRHATSKIRQAADLVGVATFGFRGEALPAIASVSRLTLETSEGDGGTSVEVHGGRVERVADAVRRRGTTVTVRGLFYNVPARRKFLRAVASETRAALDALATLALAHPAVGLVLVADGTERLRAAPGESRAARLASVWGMALAETLLPVSHAAGGVRVEGFAQRPADARPTGRRTQLLVNGRPFRDPFLVRAAEAGYRSAIHPGDRPSLFLALEVAADAVDMNVHPAKLEVRFRDRIAVERVVEDAVRLALGATTAAATLGAPTPVWRAATSPGGAGAAATPAALAAAHDLFAPLDAPAPGAAPAAEAAPALPARVTQLFDSYLVCETGDTVLFVDQHSAHERILYEETMARLADGGAPAQRLLLPLTLDLTDEELDAVAAHGDALARVGFEVEPFGGRTVVVHAVPSPHPRFDAGACLRDLVADLARGRFGGWVSPLERFAQTFACRAAIKAGEPLGEGEMRALLGRLFACALPPHDVHGRATIVQLPREELERRFGRR